MLAIIIPFYKITFFEETLKSLANQTDKRFRVYIGDDASPDNCQQLIEAYSQSILIHYHKYTQNLGQTSLVSHWQRCVSLISDEKWIMILGDDDVLSENYVQSFYENISEIEIQGINVIRFSSTIIDGYGKSISHRYTHPVIELSTISYIKKAKGKSRASLSEHIFRKSIFDVKGFIDMPDAWHSDDLAIFEISEYGNIYTINSSQAFIRYSPESISGNKSNSLGKNTATFKFLNYLLDHKSGCFTQKQRYFLIWFLFKKQKNFRILTFKSCLKTISRLAKNTFN